MPNCFYGRLAVTFTALISTLLISKTANATLPLDEARITNQRLYNLQLTEAEYPALNCLATQVGNQTLLVPAHCVFSSSDSTFYPLRHLRLTPLFSQDDRYTYASVVSVTTDHKKLSNVSVDEDWAILEVDAELGCHQNLPTLLNMASNKWDAEPVQIAVLDTARDVLSVETCLLDSESNGKLWLTECDELSEIVSGTPVLSLIGAKTTLVGLVTDQGHADGLIRYQVTSIEPALRRLTPQQLCATSAF
ncbi:hypothetical protein JCM19239_5732 [Vibrio variabilis]|uniref:Uncharacterized protein n=1 Tax=Vibrio variabilis TaxID=990271 RepID=A0ABQ0JNG3_9VIBR|nr:hypothetical protein JCM19239_5732 [Vibrio variabilis]